MKPAGKGIRMGDCGDTQARLRGSMHSVQDSFNQRSELLPSQGGETYLKGLSAIEECPDGGWEGLEGVLDDVVGGTGDLPALPPGVGGSGRRAGRPEELDGEVA